MKIEELDKQLNKLRAEIEADKNELTKVPDRFKELIQSELDKKVIELKDLEFQFDNIVEKGSTERLQEPLNMLQEIINKFLNHYKFNYPQDKEMFINQIVFEENDDELLVNLKPKEQGLTSNNKYNKDILKVTFEDGKIIQRPKSTETFIDVLYHFTITRVKSLNLVFLGVPLIADYRHEKYQQKEIEKDLYVLTQISKEKKREIIELIGKKFNKKLKVEFAKN